MNSILTSFFLVIISQFSPSECLSDPLENPAGVTIGLSDTRTTNHSYLVFKDGDRYVFYYKSPEQPTFEFFGRQMTNVLRWAIDREMLRGEKRFRLFYKDGSTVDQRLMDLVEPDPHEFDPLPAEQKPPGPV